MKNNKYETREKIKENLKRGDYELIEAVLKKEYTAGTIRHMVNNRRKIQQSVIDAANRVILSREALIES